MEQGGELPQTPPLQPPFASWLNRSIPHWQLMKSDPVRDTQQTLKSEQTDMPSLLRSALLRVPPRAMQVLKKKKATLSNRNRLFSINDFNRLPRKLIRYIYLFKMGSIINGLIIIVYNLKSHSFGEVLTNFSCNGGTKHHRNGVFSS